MFRGIYKRIQRHLMARRKWNHTRRHMRSRTEGRLVISLYSSGSLRLEA